MADAPETRYAKTDDGVHIAYQVVGDGPFDLVLVPGFVSNVEHTQTFFRVGKPVLELIGPDEPTGDEPARFYGIAFTVADLDATAAFLGEGLGDVKDAVQPGRRIATLRRAAGAGIPVAFMSPGPDAVDLTAPA
jgi:hypothetical protein